MSIVLHIERLVIDEALLGGERAVAIGQAIERELGLRLAQPGAVNALRGLGTLAAMPPATLPAASAVRNGLGVRVASAVQHSLVPALGRGSHG